MAERFGVKVRHARRRGFSYSENDGGICHKIPQKNLELPAWNVVGPCRKTILQFGYDPRELGAAVGGSPDRRRRHAAQEHAQRQWWKSETDMHETAHYSMCGPPLKEVSIL